MKVLLNALWDSLGSGCSTRSTYRLRYRLFLGLSTSYTLHTPLQPIYANTSSSTTHTHTWSTSTKTCSQIVTPPRSTWYLMVLWVCQLLLWNSLLCRLRGLWSALRRKHQRAAGSGRRRMTEVFAWSFRGRKLANQLWSCFLVLSACSCGWIRRTCWSPASFMNHLRTQLTLALCSTKHQSGNFHLIHTQGCEHLPMASGGWASSQRTSRRNVCCWSLWLLYLHHLNRSQLELAYRTRWCNSHSRGNSTAQWSYLQEALMAAPPRPLLLFCWPRNPRDDPGWKPWARNTLKSTSCWLRSYLCFDPSFLSSRQSSVASETWIRSWRKRDNTPFSENVASWSQCHFETQSPPH